MVSEQRLRAGIKARLARKKQSLGYAMTKTAKDVCIGSEVTSGEDSQRQGREEQPNPSTTSTTRAKSRDMITNLEARLSRLEERVNERDEHLEFIDHRMDGLRLKTQNFRKS